jgi:hypothetical protein
MLAIELFSYRPSLLLPSLLRLLSEGTLLRWEEEEEEGVGSSAVEEPAAGSALGR